MGKQRNYLITIMKIKINMSKLKVVQGQYLNIKVTSCFLILMGIIWVQEEVKVKIQDRREGIFLVIKRVRQEHQMLWKVLRSNRIRGILK